jgi:predicted nucleotidyltransferase component of viral defense system
MLVQMIDRDEIEAQSEALEVHVPNVERDYVFGWLLKTFYENSFLARSLIFKGGNCMRKAYYQNTRFSSDLDFSAPDAIDPDRFLEEINNACLAAQDACGVEFHTDRTSFVADRMVDAKRQAFKGRIYFKDFYGENADLTISVKLDVTEFDRLMLSPIGRPLIHPYSDAAACSVTIQCMALEELLANKLKCLLQRRHSFDLYDLVYAAFFERTIAVDRGLVLSTFLRKTIFERSPGPAKQILLGLPMPFFKGVWNKYIVCPIASRFDFEQVTDAYNATIEMIFGDSSVLNRGPDPFYPAEYRNMILEAGAARKLMSIRYKGHERQIEPYALAYKRRQDGFAAEYFYAFDQTGGSRSGPGIKTFFHHEIEELSTTEESFEPRYEIELSKAGEAHKKGYFGKAFGSAGASGRRIAAFRPATRFAASYTVECPYCQKRFKRTTASTALNPHKDQAGYPCRSRRGVRV